MYKMTKGPNTANVSKEQIPAMRAQGWVLEGEEEVKVQTDTTLADQIKSIGGMTRNEFDVYVATSKVVIPDDVKKLDAQKAFVIEALTAAPEVK